MEQQVIADILEKAEGVSAKAGSYEAPEELRLTFCLGRPGQSMLIQHVVKCRLDDRFVQIESSERGMTWFVTYDSVHGIALRGARPDEPRKAGF